jgi:valyl-tRNA synthetase
VEPGRQIPAYLATGEHHDMLSRHIEIVASLARLDRDALHLRPALASKPEQSVSQVVSGGIEIYLPLSGLVDVAAEIERLTKDLAQLEGRIKGSRVRLDNPGFVNKAPAPVVEKEREKLADMELQAEKLQARLKMLG